MGLPNPMGLVYPLGMNTNTTTKAPTRSIPVSEWKQNLEGEPCGLVNAASPYADELETLEIGQRGYLIETIRENRSTWTLQTAPALTNQSFEPRAEGWLGTTNNVARYGRGFVEVVHIGPRVIRVKQIAEVEQDGQTMSPDEQLAELATTWREAQQGAEQAREALATAARAAHAGGMSAYRVQQLTGASEPTVRKWLAR